MPAKPKPVVQVLILVPDPKTKQNISGSRSFKAPAKYKPVQLLESLLHSAGLAIEAESKEHFS